MKRKIAIGIQNFYEIREDNYFYVDKTAFIKEWWESGDRVTLIARPRRFGKTLNMSMLENFFSMEYANRGDLFEGLSIWKEEEYRKLQGTYPVISLSFANIKEKDYESTKIGIYQILTDLYDKHSFLLDSGLLYENEKKYFLSVNTEMEEIVATRALHKLSDFLSRYYGKKVIILLDEYDTPMQEAYVQGYFQYDSKKSGGVTRSHIRISDKQIRRPYYVDNPSLVVVSKEEYIYKYDVLDNIKDGGTLLLNTKLDKDLLIKSLPNKVKNILAKKNIKFYAIDAYKLVNELGLKNKISTCMEICIFDLIKIMDTNKVLEIMRESNVRRFSHKGDAVIEVNNKIIENALDKIYKIEVNTDWINLSYEERNDLSFEDTIGLLKGDSLPVSAFLERKEGIFPGGTTKKEKRECYKLTNAGII